MFGGAQTQPAADPNDPYSNIDIDLTKVKTATVAAKPFEHKTEEEKVKDAEARGNIKSNLKTTKSDFDKAKDSKKGVKFGKSTTYEVSGDDNLGFQRERSGSPRPGKRIIEEKDISDGRNEDERVRDMLE